MKDHQIIETPVHKATTKTFLKRLSYRWGAELGDTREFAVGTSGNSAWIRGPGVDLSGSPKLLVAIAIAINEVLSAAEADETEVPL